MNADDIIRALGGEPPRKEEASPFNASRFPYTYGCDYVRMGMGYSSRGEASGAVRKLCAERGIDPDIAFTALAYAYMRYWGIRKP